MQQNYKDNLTEDEKKTIEDEIDRIEDALEIIEKVEDVENKINNLPDTITKNDTDAICNACGEKREVAGDSDAPGVLGTPEAGDSAQMMRLIICTISSGIVIVYSSVKRRKRG